MTSNSTRINAVLLMLFLLSGMGPARTKYLIEVHGLSCPFCAYGLEKRLKALENVEEVLIDMNDGEVVIIASQPIDEDKIRKAVKKAGFKVASLKEESVEGRISE